MLSHVSWLLGRSSFSSWVVSERIQVRDQELRIRWMVQQFRHFTCDLCPHHPRVLQGSITSVYLFTSFFLLWASRQIFFLFKENRDRCGNYYSSGIVSLFMGLAIFMCKYICLRCLVEVESKPPLIPQRLFIPPPPPPVLGSGLVEQYVNKKYAAWFSFIKYREFYWDNLF